MSLDGDARLRAAYQAASAATPHLSDETWEGLLAESLPAAERDAALEHVLACAECTPLYRGLLQMRREAGAFDAGVPRLRAHSAAYLRGPRWLALAATLAVAAGAGILLRRSEPPISGAPAPSPTPAALASPASTNVAAHPGRETLERLGRFTPPRFLGSALRGDEGRSEAFGRGLSAYERGDYRAAATALRAASGAGGPDAQAARFFLGVSELLAGDPARAAAELRAVAEGGDPAYAEAARFHLAKALILLADLSAARVELETIARGDGDYVVPARTLLRQLDAVAGR